MPQPSSELTLTLLRIQAEGPGDPAATRRVFEAAHTELRRLASRLLSRERADHTLQPTDLVHEAYLRLINAGQVGWQSRAHFFGIAARAMRQILVEHARRRAAAKRGGNPQRVMLEDGLGLRAQDAIEMLELEEALNRLAEVDERSARVVELRFFGGLTVDEAAHVLGVSRRTVHDDWRVAKMWLRREIAGGEG